MSATLSPINTSLCIESHTNRVDTTTSNGTFCACYTEYYGDYCEKRHDFFIPFLYAITAIRLAALLYFLLWAFLKVSHLIRTKAFRFKKLSVVSLLLLIGGMLTRVMYDITNLINPYLLAGVGPMAKQQPGVSTFLSVIVSVCVLFDIAATSLILGFWFDVLQQKLRPSMAARTKIVTIVGACLVLLAIPGIILSLRRIAVGLAAFLIFAPLVINVVGLIVLVCLVGCMKSTTKKLSEANRKKQKYAVKNLAWCVAFWVMNLISVVLFITSSTVTPENKASIAIVNVLASVIGTISEIAICLCIMLLVDRHGGMKKHLKFAFCDVYFADTRTNRGSLSSGSASNSSSGMGSKNSADTNSNTTTNTKSSTSNSISEQSKQDEEKTPS